MAELSYNKAIIKKGRNLILHGRRNFRDGLWDIRLPTIDHKPKQQVANVIVKLESSKSKLADFLHGCLFSPCPSMLMKAIKNNHLLSWPGIQQIDFSKYVNDNVATFKGT